MSGQAPDFVIGGPSLVDEPHAPVILGNRLWVPNRFDADIGNDDFGLFGFNDPATLTSGVFPDVMLTTPVEEVHQLQGAGNAVIGITTRFNSMFVYMNPAGVRDRDFPHLVFFDPRADQPVSLRAVER